MLDFYCILYIKAVAKNIHIYLMNLLIAQHAIYISSLLRNAVFGAVKLCLIISTCVLR